MQSRNTTAVRSPRSRNTGDPHPEPRDRGLDEGSDDDPKRHRADRLAGEDDRAVTPLAGQPVKEGEHASGGDVSLGEEDDGDDQHHQEVNEQGAERAGLLSEPADRGADVGLDPGGEGTGRRLGEVVPRPGETGAEGDGVEPGRRRRDRERGE
jgi:hypothetical protein